MNQLTKEETSMIRVALTCLKDELSVDLSKAKKPTAIASLENAISTIESAQKKLEWNEPEQTK